jgi:hypothetical protein
MAKTVAKNDWHWHWQCLFASANASMRAAPALVVVLAWAAAVDERWAPRDDDGARWTSPLMADLPTAFEERLDAARAERGVFGTVASLEAAAEATYERLAARYGPRLRLPRSPQALVAAWPSLFGEAFEHRRDHSAVVVVLHCFSDPAREAALRAWRLGPLRRRRHVLAADRLDVGAGFLGFPDDDDRSAFTTDGDKYLGAHRPLLSLLFANDTWGGSFDWLAHGDDDTRFDLAAVSAFLGTRDAAKALFLGQPGHRHYGCKPRTGPERLADPFACCQGTAEPCDVAVTRDAGVDSHFWRRIASLPLGAAEQAVLLVRAEPVALAVEPGRGRRARRRDAVPAARPAEAVLPRAPAAPRRRVPVPLRAVARPRPLPQPGVLAVRRHRLLREPRPPRARHAAALGRVRGQARLRQRRPARLDVPLQRGRPARVARGAARARGPRRARARQRHRRCFLENAAGASPR